MSCKSLSASHPHQFLKFHCDHSCSESVSFFSVTLACFQLTMDNRNKHKQDCSTQDNKTRTHVIDVKFQFWWKNDTEVSFQKGFFTKNNVSVRTSKNSANSRQCLIQKRMRSSLTGSTSFKEIFRLRKKMIISHFHWGEEILGLKRCIQMTLFNWSWRKGLLWANDKIVRRKHKEPSHTHIHTHRITNQRRTRGSMSHIQCIQLRTRPLCALSFTHV